MLLTVLTNRTEHLIPMARTTKTTPIPTLIQLKEDTTNGQR